MRICNKFKFISRLINGFYLWLRRYSLSTRFFIVCISLCIVPLILATGIVFLHLIQEKRIITFRLHSRTWCKQVIICLTV